MKNTITNWYNAITLFFAIVFRDFSGARINIKTAWKVSSGIWL